MKMLIPTLRIENIYPIQTQRESYYYTTPCWLGPTGRLDPIDAQTNRQSGHRLVLPAPRAGSKQVGSGRWECGMTQKKHHRLDEALCRHTIVAFSFA